MFLRLARSLGARRAPEYAPWYVALGRLQRMQVRRAPFFLFLLSPGMARAAERGREGAVQELGGQGTRARQGQGRPRHNASLARGSGSRAARVGAGVERMSQQALP